MTPNFHALTVADVHSEIGGAATSVTFEVPLDLGDTFRWTAGQHLTLRFTLKGQEERRSYTISNPPDADLRITVKRVKGGLVSNHVGDTLRAGDKVEVMPPFGGFTLSPDAAARRTHYFFGAGSGITPLFAMIHAVLKDEPHSVAHLIYGNRAADDILFREEFEALASAHPDRFTLRHVLSSPSMLSWFTPWQRGRLGSTQIAKAIAETPPVAQDVQYWICGPGSMNGDVSSALMEIDAPTDRIHMESFGGASVQDTSVSGVAATAHVTLNRTTHEVAVAADQTLLDAMRSAGLFPPHSCQSGVCGACRATIRTGQVHMRNRVALEDHEIARGDVLTCQSVARSEKLEILFNA